MARILSKEDIEVLTTLAPECRDLACANSGAQFRSILPPVANHFVRDAEDFRLRLASLPEARFRYLVERILDGSESLGCLPPEYATILMTAIAERYSRDSARMAMRIYAASESCDD